MDSRFERECGIALYTHTSIFASSGNTLKCDGGTQYSPLQILLVLQPIILTESAPDNNAQETNSLYAIERFSARR